MRGALLLLSIAWLGFAACGGSSEADSADAGGVGGGASCTTYVDCLTAENWNSAGPACVDGHCVACETDADCGAGHCQDGRCYDCLVDAHCPAEAPWCDFRPESTDRRCYECTVAHECAPGAYCPLGGMFQQGAECIIANCATFPDGDECLGCVHSRGWGNCPECEEARLAHEACSGPAAASGCYYPDCCKAEYDAWTVCLATCVGDLCD